MAEARARVVISGNVQGVFFRSETQRASEDYDISGWVKNKKNGTVEAVFEGEEDDINAMIEWCWEGSPYSKVKNVEVSWEDYTGEFIGFEITY
ncbi:acylphosphatase [Desulfonema magnum]|uniref:Acylphosphatase n=1 Tax=Desulfonema magnum TaxID=45655 RepID=A0A975BPW6_9BACT|nr:acylphosphatase [Desulfonema magnum]QTA89453.1 Acylphosphatase [Desulfonema magnum]